MKMGAYARSEVTQCRTAFERATRNLRATSRARIADINRLNREIFRLAIAIGDDPDTREWAMHMALVARRIERIGDNAVDIGEQVGSS